MAKIIYYAQSCDAWKSKDSMRLLFIGTSKQKLAGVIAKEIAQGNMEYNNTELSPKQQAQAFRKDLIENGLEETDRLLQYGYIRYTYNNVEI